MEYLHKIDKIDTDTEYWNIPEQKTGTMNVIGGNGQAFKTSVRTVEYLTANFPLKSVNLVLPDALKSTLPPLPGVNFLKSTDSGSFAEAAELEGACNAADFSLFIGDFSKNSITRAAVGSACVSSEKPLLLTRDTVDLIAEEQTDKWLMNSHISLLATMPQLIKIFHAVYYPKMLLLSQPLVHVAEALHKFTLSYPVKITTLHDGQIIIAENGEISVLPLSNTEYSPLTLWLGTPAARIMALNLFNPNNFTKATLASLMKK
ncbi:hypothetical protein IJ135_01230 [Candidatus Saccharibacteria bacterium]|nr:hypothetical protein [Candidatus Saccharibacteria bacterium]